MHGSGKRGPQRRQHPHQHAAAPDLTATAGGDGGGPEADIHPCKRRTRFVLCLRVISRGVKMATLEANRYLYLTTPLGEDKLLLEGFSGHEALSQLYSFHLRLKAENGTSVDFDKLLGQKVSFGIQGAESRQEAR